MTLPRSGPPLVAAVRQYLGAPWVHQGRAADGPDCAGLLHLGLRKLGWTDLPDVAAYGRLPWRDGLRRAVEAFYGRPVGGLQVGDVVLMARRKGKPESHIAIVGDYCLGGLSLIHTRADVGSVVEHRLSDDERACIVAAYR